MDFINEAQKLADAVRDKAQEVASNTVNSVEELVDGINNTTVQITASTIIEVTLLLKNIKI